MVFVIQNVDNILCDKTTEVCLHMRKAESELLWYCILC